MKVSFTNYENIYIFETYFQNTMLHYKLLFNFIQNTGQWMPSRIFVHGAVSMLSPSLASLYYSFYWCSLSQQHKILTGRPHPRRQTKERHELQLINLNLYYYPRPTWTRQVTGESTEEGKTFRVRELQVEETPEKNSYHEYSTLTSLYIKHP